MARIGHCRAKGDSRYFCSRAERGRKSDLLETLTAGKKGEKGLGGKAESEKRNLRGNREIQIFTSDRMMYQDFTPTTPCDFLVG